MRNRNYENREVMHQKIVIEGKTYGQTAKELDCSATAVRNWAIKFDFPKEPLYIKLNREHGEKIENDYTQNNKFFSEIAEDYGVNWQTVSDVLRHRNIKIRTRSDIKKKLDSENKCRVYDINRNYFETWSNNMAYILGFICADGCVHTHYDEKLNKSKNVVIISLEKSDIEILHKIKDEIGYEGEVHTYKSKGFNKESHYCTLRMNSVQLVKSLKSLGVTERKSLTIKMPPVPEEYQLDFIRGYFDGDGSVGGQYPSNSFGIKTTKQQIRFRLFSGSRDIIESMELILRNKGLKKKNINKQRSVYEILYSTKESIKIYNMMYYDGCLHLYRKKKKFDELIQTRESQLAAN
ncbi:LAGLIDADG family homing endonuclease [Alkalihalophilus pseudofirmus]|uniref:LAGLIDADG family homing endonuclease n=1 Tax=Alkalihalophilus pseudofirmus TaxID=79885 RepID=UPI00259BC182|nr:LAGLIDADG family homing endonuclease [Alkalihalophilus pseudofirmus]WEG18632.1 LAGLIDADG family homing endonuclease [Alkalihalophilus pseudofirmus]